MTAAAERTDRRIIKNDAVSMGGNAKKERNKAKKTVTPRINSRIIPLNKTKIPPKNGTRIIGIIKSIHGIHSIVKELPIIMTLGKTAERELDKTSNAPENASARNMVASKITTPCKK